MKLQEIEDFAKELCSFSQEELTEKENKLKEELLDLRLQTAAGQLNQTVRLDEVKEQVVRVKAMRSEKK